jgi:molybdopterin-guanine dinucleotide biosynthesis protein A
VDVEIDSVQFSGLWPNIRGVEEQPSATLLVLAGGFSRRMGRSKAMLPVAGKPLIEYLIDRLRPVFAEVLISSNDISSLPAGLNYRVVPDLHPGAGPLSGIEAGLEAAVHDLVFAVACDMPAVVPELASLLVAAARDHDAAVPRFLGYTEPACACYRRTALPAIRAALLAGRFKAVEALHDLKVRYVDEHQLREWGLGPEVFWNINTPEDYQVFLASL